MVLGQIDRRLAPFALLAGGLTSDEGATPDLS
jgi:hypothetical protein